MKTAAVALLGLAFGWVAEANPVDVRVPVVTDKQWERCFAAVDAKGAAISCEVGYAITNESAGQLDIRVPIFWKADEAFSEQAFVEKCRPRLEAMGELTHAYHIEAVKDPAKATPKLQVPAGMTLVFCDFSITVPEGSKSFSIVASYWQAASEQGVPYVPLFEDPEKKRDEALYTFTAFPTGTEHLKLASSHAGKTTALKSRVSVTPKHNELILIRAVKGDADVVPEP